VATSTTTRERCRAWLEACRGDLRAARARLGAAADASRTDGVYVFELALRHDLVRFGDAAGAVARVEELAAVVEGPLGQGMVAHARGVAASDPAELERAVSQFEAIDALVLAAEAAADLSDAWRRQGDQRQGAAAMQRSVRLARMVGGARTPPLLRGEGVEPLTSREREVALLAAQGWTSRDIAGRLFLSARTVDTHLARVYRKLGVSGREDLAGALAGAAADTP
jgi:ATP/maltotriose-dependent transcriptional regulator MalT